MRSPSDLTHYREAIEQSLRRSPWWNALPHTIERIDLTKTELQDPSFAADWLKQLLHSGALRAEVNAHVSVAPKLSHLYFEEQNGTRIEGEQRLGFGYPLVIERDEHNPMVLMAAPLFVWSLEMHPSPNRIDTWTFSRRPGDPIYPNEVLLRQLLMRHKVDNRDQFRAAVADNVLNDDTLTRLCNKLAVQLDSTGNITSLDVRSCPTVAELQSLEEDQTILSWSGVIGLFAPEQVQSATLLSRMMGSAAESSPAAVPPPVQAHPYGLLATDPAQAEVLRRVDTHQALVVQGSAHTGKTQLLANLCSNLLAAGGSAIVTARNSPALQRVQFELMRAGLEDYTFAFSGQPDDRAALLAFIRRRYQALKGTDTSSSTVDIDATIAQLQAHRSGDSITKERTAIFGEADFGAVVGAFLEVQRIHGRELLLGQVDARRFQFDEATYEELSQVVLRSESLYEGVKTLRHPLNRLHDHHFTDYGAEESLELIENDLARLRKRGEELRYQLITVQAAYGESLRQHYEAHYLHLLGKLNQLKQLLEDNRREFGEAFEARSGFSVAVGSAFSSKSRRLVEAREVLLREYRKLQELHREQPYFVYNFEEVSRHDAAKIKAYIRDYEVQLRDWHRNIPSFIQREAQQLNHQTALIQTGQRDRLQTVEISVEEYLSDLNEAQLYTDSIETRPLTYLPELEQRVERILELLSETDANLSDYDAYYAWRVHWLGLDEGEQHLVQALTRVDPHDWHAAFSAWYYHHVLDQAHTPQVSEQPDVLPQLARLEADLGRQLLAHIRHLWDERQREAIRNFKKRHKQTASAIFGRTKKEDPLLKLPTEVLLPRLAHLLPTLAPVMMATPTHLTEELLPTLQPEADLLLIDDADTLSAAHTAMLLPYARRHVAFADHTRDLLTDEDHIADYLIRRGAEALTVNYLHYTGPEAATLWQAAVQPDRVLRRFRPPTSASNQSLVVVAADGRYDEQARTNDVEARRVMSLLNDIQRDDHDKYPGVGIVCFTVPQRNLVQAYFLKIQQKRAAGSEKISRLEDEGMRVMHISELRGQSFDVLIACFTYGTTDASGSMSEAVETFNDDHGPAMLTTLLSAYRERLYLMHSIPKADLRLYAREPQHRGTYLLAQLLAYAEADTTDGAERVLDGLRAATGKAAQVEDDRFKAAVMQSMHTYFPARRLVDESPVNGLAIPAFSVLPAYEGQATALVMCDRIPLIDGAYVWLTDLLERLRGRGYSLHYTSPVDWWKQPEQAARKLAAGIVKEDEQYAPSLPLEDGAPANTANATDALGTQEMHRPDDATEPDATEVIVVDLDQKKR